MRAYTHTRGQVVRRILRKKKKEKEAKTKRGKKVEHNGRRKEWTSLKKPGAERGGGRVGEETEKNQATKKRRQR